MHLYEKWSENMAKNEGEIMHERGRAHSIWQVQLPIEISKGSRFVAFSSKKVRPAIIFIHKIRLIILFSLYTIERFYALLY